MRLALAIVFVSPLFAQPALPYLDWKACPFERCSYREWTARKPAMVYDSWEANRHPIGNLTGGEKVTGITGVVITIRPGVIRMDRDLPKQGLRQGDLILTYAYRGEGYSAVWVDGKYDPEFDISFTRWPAGARQGCGGDHCAATSLDPGEKVWWAEVRLRSGKTGWVNMSESDFDYGD